MAATFITGGGFLATEGDSPRNISIDCTGASLLVVRIMPDSGDTIGTPTFNGSSLTQVGSVGSFTQWVLVNPSSTTANLSVPITDTYGRVQGEWEAWSDTDTTTPYGTAFSSSGTSSTPSVTPSDPSSGGANSAGVWHNYSTSMSTTAGTAVGTSAYNGGSGWRTWGAYRSTSGSLSWSSGDSSSWVVLGLPINGVGATNTTITCNQGTYSISGQTAALTVSRVITGSQGSYTLTGQSATLTKTTPGAFSIAADSGTYTITGSSGLAQYAMNANYGTYTVTGQDVILNKSVPASFFILADSGLYTLSGRSARLIWSNAPIVTHAGGYQIAVSVKIGL